MEGSDLKANNQMLNLIINNIPEYIYWKNEKLTLIGCNNNFAKLLGFESKDDIIGKCYNELFTEEQADIFHKMDEEILKTKMPIYEQITKYNDRNGSQKWIKMNKIPLYGDNEDIIGVLSTFYDITQNVELSSKLKINDQKHKLLIETTNTSYLILNEHLKIKEANTSFIKMMDCQSECDLLGNSPRAWIHSDYVKDFDTAFRDLIDNEKTINDMEIKIITYKNKIVCATLCASIIKNGETNIFCLIRDISVKKNGEEGKFIQKQKQKDRIKQNISNIRGQLKKFSL